MAASAEEHRAFEERTAAYWGRTALYRLFNSNDVLLYIGIANNPDARWEQHAREKHWWPQVDRSTVEWFNKRIDAAAAEESAIPAERPLYNEKHQPIGAVVPVRRHGGGGTVSTAGSMKVTVESFTMTAAIANLTWATRAATAARWELGELPVTYLTSHGQRTVALVPVWLADWAVEHAEELFKSVAADRAKTAPADS